MQKNEIYEFSPQNTAHCKLFEVECPRYAELNFLLENFHG